MSELETMTGNEESEGISLVAFKYGESPFASKHAFYNDTLNTTLTIAWLFYLIRYKGRNILVDVGSGDLGLFSRYGFQLDKFTEPVGLLKEYGLLPQMITDVIITHADFDHIGDINYYRNVNIYIQEDELKVKRDCFENIAKVSTFSTSIKLFEKFTVENIGGHTIGSSIVTFKHGQREYVLGGDECYINANLEKKIPTGRTYNIAKSIGFVEKYSQPDYVVLLCHEPGIIKGDTGYKTILL